MRHTAVLLFAICSTLFAQDGFTGLGRIYIEPMAGGLDQYLSVQLVREHLPVVQVTSLHSADCVMGYEPPQGPSIPPLPSMKKEKLQGTIVLVDMQQRRIAWVLNLRDLPFADLKQKQERNVAAHIASKMKHDGAYCGGSAFSAPTQNMEDRIKAFKPPTFNWWQ